MRMTNISRTVRRHLQWKVVPIWKTYKPEANFKYSPLVMDWIVPKKNLLCSTQIINYAQRSLLKILVQGFFQIFFICLNEANMNANGVKIIQN